MFIPNPVFKVFPVITVEIKTILTFKSIFGAESAMTLPDGSTLDDLLQAMAEKYGDSFRSQMFQPDTTIPRDRIRLMINGRDIAFLDRLQTRLHTADEVLILPPVAGG